MSKRNTKGKLLMAVAVIASIILLSSLGFALYQLEVVGSVAQYIAPKWLILAGVACTTIQLIAMAYRERIIATYIAEVETKDNENQAALLSMLDNIVSLSEGDLTVKASIDEGFTTPIADALNLAVESLRTLVMSVDKSANDVSTATSITQEQINQVSKASLSQRESLIKSRESIEKLEEKAKSISEIAMQSKKLSNQSTEIARSGDELTSETTHCMDKIRAQTSDTSKRIKRLSESSQQISEMGQIVADIAEQTNILSLNASIQAALAGEMGKGFSVVATEVQRLAERCGQTTRQINALVENIQLDAATAADSMEQTTSLVVEGSFKLNSTTELFLMMNRKIYEQDELNTTIAERASTQSDMTEFLMSLLNESVKTAESNLDLTRSSVRNTDSLSNMALGMSHAIAGFKFHHDQNESEMSFSTKPEME